VETPTTNNAPTVDNPIADQTATVGTVFSFALPLDVFSDVEDGIDLSYAFLLSDGSPLPAWLTFDPTTLAFTGTPTEADVGELTITVTATDSEGLSVSDEFVLVVDANATAQVTQLSTNTNDVFKISSNNTTARLQVTVTERNSSLVNELIAFTVDDDNGTINGIAPGAEGYIAAALARSSVVFSSIANVPNGFSSTNITRTLEFAANTNVKFALVKNNTFSNLNVNSVTASDIIFFSSSSQSITTLSNNAFSLAWQDGSNSNTSVFNDLVVNVQATDDPIPLGTNLQGQTEGEVIDLRSASSFVTATFTVNREAAFDNYVGFYQVTGEDGGIDLNNDGVADLLPGQAGYLQAAVNQRIAGIDLTVSNQGTATYTGTLSSEAIFAPFIIVNGRPEAILDTNTGNDPAVYFSYLGANSDGFDHIRLLGNNIFGFEDLPNGGDKDYNDVIVKVELSIA
jgi:hypothetical protein